MGKIIAIVNQKGGVAKTTTAINLAAALGQRGKKVLLVDLDPQGNATSGLGINRSALTVCIYDVLLRDAPPQAVQVKTEFRNLTVLPATLNLANAEVGLVSAICREKKLNNALRPLLVCYDYIFIDCPPSLGLLTINALTCANSLIIPLQCEFYALEGLSQLLNTYQVVRNNLNSSLAIEGLLLTMYDSHTKLASQVVEETRSHFHNQVYDTVISRSVRLAEAPSHGVPGVFYDQKAKGATEYQDLAAEFLRRNHDQ